MKPFPCIAYEPADSSDGLIVAFHGWGQSVAKFRHKSGLDAVADAARCMIAYPKGRARNWGGISATKPRFADIERLFLTLEGIEGDHGPRSSIHFVGFSDGASFALFAGSCLDAGLVWPACPIASVTAYSGFCHKTGMPGSESKYPILLLHNRGEKRVRNVHQREIRKAYEDRGHVVTRVDLPRRRKWFRHHYWRAAEANPLVLKHVRDAMCEPILTRGK